MIEICLVQRYVSNIHIHVYVRLWSTGHLILQTEKNNGNLECGS